MYLKIDCFVKGQGFQSGVIEAPDEIKEWPPDDKCGLIITQRRAYITSRLMAHFGSNDPRHITIITCKYATREEYEANKKKNAAPPPIRLWEFWKWR